MRINSQTTTRYTNSAAVFSGDEDRHHEICWEVPLPGRRTNFWIPLQLNSGQEDWWHALRDEEDDSVWAGQIRLQWDGSRWVLHVTANSELEANHSYSTTDDDVTPVGFDVGESKLLPGCAFRDTCCSWMVVASDTSDRNKPVLKTD